MKTAITENEIQELVKRIHDSGIQDISIRLEIDALVSQYFYIKYYEFEELFTIAFNILNKHKQTAICMSGILGLFYNSEKLSKMSLEVIDDFYNTDNKLYRIPDSNYTH